VKQELHIRRFYVKLDHDAKQRIARKVESKSAEIVWLRVQMKIVVVVVVTRPNQYD